MKLPGIDYNVGRVPRAKRIDTEIPMQHARRMMSYAVEKGKAAAKLATIGDQARLDAYAANRDAIIKGSKITLQDDLDELRIWRNVAQNIVGSVVQASFDWWKNKRQSEVDQEGIKLESDLRKINYDVNTSRSFGASEMGPDYTGPTEQTFHDPISGETTVGEAELPPHIAAPTVKYNRSIAAIEAAASNIKDEQLRTRFENHYKNKASIQYDADALAAHKVQQRINAAELKTQFDLFDAQNDVEGMKSVLRRQDLTPDERKLANFKISVKEEINGYEEARLQVMDESIPAEDKISVLDEQIKKLTEDSILDPSSKRAQLVSLEAAKKNVIDTEKAKYDVAIAYEKNKTNVFMDSVDKNNIYALPALEESIKKLESMGVDPDDGTLVKAKISYNTAEFKHNLTSLPRGSRDLALMSVTDPYLKIIGEEALIRDTAAREEDNFQVAIDSGQLPGVNEVNIYEEGGLTKISLYSHIAKSKSNFPTNILPNKLAKNLSLNLKNATADQLIEFFQRANSELTFGNDYSRLLDQLKLTRTMKGLPVIAELSEIDMSLGRSLIQYSRIREGGQLNLPSDKELNDFAFNSMGNVSILNKSHRESLSEAFKDAYAMLAPKDSDVFSKKIAEDAWELINPGGTPELGGYNLRSPDLNMSSHQIEYYLKNVDKDYLDTLGPISRYTSEEVALEWGDRFVLFDGDKGEYFVFDTVQNNYVLSESLNEQGNPVADLLVINFEDLKSYKSNIGKGYSGLIPTMDITTTVEDL